MLAFRCPQCGVAVRIEDRWAGRQVQCGGCGCSLQAPRGKGSTAISWEGREPARGRATRTHSAIDRTEVDSVLDVVPVEEDKTLPPMPSSRRRSAARSSGALLPFFVGCLLVFGLGLLGLAGVGAWWYLKDEPTSPTSESAARPDEEVPKVEGKGWTVLLRSDDPSVWNTAGDGRNFALPLNRAPATIRYLRLRRMDTREMLILPLTRAELGVATLPAKPGGCSWNGTAKLDWGGRHLGIAQGVRHNFPIPNGTITLLNEGWDGWAGSGFGHKAFVNDTQYYAWKGQEIGRTIFEIAVTGQELDVEENRCLLSR